MRVRVAKAGDRDQVLILLNQLGEVINEFVHFDPDNVRAHEVGLANYEKAMHRDDRKVFVVVEKGRIIGVATFFILTDFITGTPFAHVDDFVIDKKWRRQGIGGELLRFVLAFAKKHGIHTVKLTTSLPLTYAHAFYEKHGGVFAQRAYKFSV